MHFRLYMLLTFCFIWQVVSSATINNSTIKTTNKAPQDDNKNLPPLHDHSSTSLVSEGGKISIPPSILTMHSGREYVSENPKNVTVGNSTVNVFKSNITKAAPPVIGISSTSSPLPDFDVPEKNDNKTSVPRKGVGDDFPSVLDSDKVTKSLATLPDVKKSSTPSTSPVAVVLKKKPTVTVPSDEILSSDLNNNNENSAKLELNSNTQIHNNNYDKDKQNNLEYYETLTSKSSRADYVVPIVAVILSVPLVAIIISVLYKRGSYWWQHRHYRRMDFLIEGMYNN